MAAALLVVACPFPDAARASCAAPSLSVLDAAVPAMTPGDVVIVEGRGFVDGCDDGGGGCTADETEPATPYADVTLTLRQGPRAWTLGTADASEAGEVAWEVTVPAGVTPGRAVLVPDVGSPLVVRVRR
ncbi:hypothetical protein LRP67_11560 [Nocardioides sp. cx-169]|uniref:hypothetical protein n=1 Tax=Nocardioides sp. cx-169 TaxID=2899080 RepID=UPI001E490F33|nr:hypothetical protein [Nocardioides sp. cx-169]MCD4534720.1 hypothetical protein [Nocardioides sp. cx-169]